jgi:ornithine--oxo-acid transaminase
LLVEERLVERAASLGSVLFAGLEAIASPLVREVRGRGLFAGVEIDTSRISARRLAEAFLAEGILTKDTHDQVLRFVPALNIPRALLDEALERIARVLRQVERDLQLA